LASSDAVAADGGRWRQLAAGAILLPFCFLKLEKLRIYFKKTEKLEKISRAFTRCLWRLLRKNSPFDL